MTNPAKKAKSPPLRSRRQLFLTAEELRKLADECGYYAPLVWFHGWSGLRFGEATALRVERVEPTRRRVRVDALQPLLAEKTADDLVFTALRGGTVRLNNFRRRVFSPAAARVGRPELVPHDLRDTAASLAISSGASIKAVQRMLGRLGEDDPRRVRLPVRGRRRSPRRPARGTLRRPLMP